MRLSYILFHKTEAKTVTNCRLIIFYWMPRRCIGSGVSTYTAVWVPLELFSKSLYMEVRAKTARTAPKFTQATLGLEATYSAQREENSLPISSHRNKLR